MIHCVAIQEITKRLELVSGLVDQYKKGNYVYPNLVIDWLDATEEVMSKLHMPEGSELSVLRSNILKVGDKFHPGIEKPSASVIRKATNAEASSALGRTEEILRFQVQRSTEKLEQFEDKLCEGFTAFLLENQLPPRTRNYMEWLSQIWTMFCQQASTKALSVYITTALVTYDRSYILEQVVSRLENQGLQSWQEAAVFNEGNKKEISLM